MARKPQPGDGGPLEPKSSGVFPVSGQESGDPADCHTCHTKPGAKYPRYGGGEITSEREARETARLFFLMLASELFPAMVEELRTLASTLPPLPLGSLAYWSLGPENNPIAAFCVRWGLTVGREPAEWACEAVGDVAARSQRSGKVVWVATWGGGAAIGSEECELGDGYRFMPELEKLKDAKKRVPRGRLWPKMTAILTLVDEEIARRGADDKSGLTRRGPRKKDPNRCVFERAVRHQIGPAKYIDLAREQAGGDPSVERLKAREASIKTEVTELLRLIGLRRPGGRLPSPAR